MNFRENLKELLSQDYAQLKGPTGEPSFDDYADYSDFIKTNVMKFPDYFNKVVESVIVGDIAAEARKNGEVDIAEYQAMIMTVDKERKTVHDVAIDSCAKLNRLCDQFNMEHIADVDISDRHEVAAFIYETCKDLYLIGQTHTKSFDDYLYKDGEINRRAREIGKDVFDAEFDKVKFEAHEPGFIGLDENGEEIVDENSEEYKIAHANDAMDYAGTHEENDKDLDIQELSEDHSDDFSER